MALKMPHQGVRASNENNIDNHATPGAIAGHGCMDTFGVLTFKVGHMGATRC
jgi:hypothetical protein